MEDNNTYSKVLETHPQWVNDGWISGRYPDYITIPDGSRFKAKVGFIHGAIGTDGAFFNIRFNDGLNSYYFPSSDGIYCANDGHLDSMNIDLSLIVGKTGRIYIGVKAGSTSDQDWAVWVNPQITNFKYFVIPPKFP